MDGLFQPTINPTTEKEGSVARPILIGIFLLGVVVAILAALLRSERPKPATPPAYAANIKFSDLQTSAAQNFVGATVSYIDGKVSNVGDKTVTHAVIQITFKDDIGQTAQREEVAIKVLRTAGPYDEAVDLNIAPLAPGQTEPFRLTFENISAQWNHAYPDLQFTQVSTK